MKPTSDLPCDEPKSSKKRLKIYRTTFSRTRARKSSFATTHLASKMAILAPQRATLAPKTGNLTLETADLEAQLANWACHGASQSIPESCERPPIDFCSILIRFG